MSRLRKHRMLALLAAGSMGLQMVSPLFAEGFGDNVRSTSENEEEEKESSTSAKNDVDKENPAASSANNSVLNDVVSSGSLDQGNLNTNTGSACSGGISLNAMDEEVFEEVKSKLNLTPDDQINHSDSQAADGMSTTTRELVCAESTGFSTEVVPINETQSTHWVAWYKNNKDDVIDKSLENGNYSGFSKSKVDTWLNYPEQLKKINDNSLPESRDYTYPTDTPGTEVLPFWSDVAGYYDVLGDPKNGGFQLDSYQHFAYTVKEVTTTYKLVPAGEEPLPGTDKKTSAVDNSDLDELLAKLDDDDFLASLDLSQFSDLFTFPSAVDTGGDYQTKGMKTTYFDPNDLLGNTSKPHDPGVNNSKSSNAGAFFQALAEKTLNVFTDGIKAAIRQYVADEKANRAAAQTQSGNSNQTANSTPTNPAKTETKNDTPAADTNKSTSNTKTAGNQYQSATSPYAASGSASNTVNSTRNSTSKTVQDTIQEETKTDSDEEEEKSKKSEDEQKMLEENRKQIQEQIDIYTQPQQEGEPDVQYQARLRYAQNLRSQYDMWEALNDEEGSTTRIVQYVMVDDVVNELRATETVTMIPGTDQVHVASATAGEGIYSTQMAGFDVLSLTAGSVGDVEGTVSTTPFWNDLIPSYWENDGAYTIHNDSSMKYHYDLMSNVGEGHNTVKLYGFLTNFTDHIYPLINGFADITQVEGMTSRDYPKGLARHCLDVDGVETCATAKTPLTVVHLDITNPQNPQTLSEAERFVRHTDYLDTDKD